MEIKTPKNKKGARLANSLVHTRGLEPLHH